MMSSRCYVPWFAVASFTLLVACGKSKPSMTLVTTATAGDDAAVVASGPDAAGVETGQPGGQPDGHSDGEPGGPEDGADFDGAEPDQAPVDRAVEIPVDTIEDDTCRRYCAVLAMLSCAPEPVACLAACEENLAGRCGKESRANAACVALKTPTDFLCDARGRIRLLAGNCDAQEGALVACLTGGAAP